MELAAWQTVYCPVGGAVLNPKSKSPSSCFDLSVETPFDAEMLTSDSMLPDLVHGSQQSLQLPQALPHPHPNPSQHPFVNDFNSPNSHHHIQKLRLSRSSSVTAFPTGTPIPMVQTIARTSSDFIQHPKPLPVGQFQGTGRGRLQWNLGSEG